MESSPYSLDHILGPSNDTVDDVGVPLDTGLPMLQTGANTFFDPLSLQPVPKPASVPELPQFVLPTGHLSFYIWITGLIFVIGVFIHAHAMETFYTSEPNQRLEKTIEYSFQQLHKKDHLIQPTTELEQSA